MDNARIHALSHEELVAWLKSHTYLDPLWDASFKLLIADATHPERLVHFLNALLRLEGPEEILTADLRIQEHPSPFGYEKGIAFDIHCVNQRGEPIVVEMQRKGTNHRHPQGPRLRNQELPAAQSLHPLHHELQL